MSRLFLVLLAVFALGGCFQKSGKLSDLTPREAMGLLRNDFAILIDLRAPAAAGETAEVRGDAPDPSLAIPAERFLEGDFETVRQTLPQGKQILLCCEAPEAVSRVARKLNDAGFDVGRVGTLDDWRGAGLPVLKR